MNKIIKVMVAGAILAIGAVSASAQNTYSAYFLDNYLYRHQMNPAFGNESGFVGFPVLGNINAGMRGNLHIDDVLYNIDGKTSLFTNPNISVSEAMGKFEDKNRLGFDLKLDLINVGFKAFGGYNTVGINLYTGAEVSIPKSFFSLLKEGISNKTYSIEDLGAHADAYAEIALNHSHDIKQVPGLRVGGTLKFLVGLGSLDAEFKNAKLNLGVDKWSIESNADLYAAVKGMTFKYGHDDGSRYVDGFDMDGFGVNGFGMGLDLGATYKYRDFNFSLAVLDLGFMNWSNALHASTKGVKKFELDKYAFDVTGNDKDDNGDSTWDNMRDDLAKLYQLEDDSKTSRTDALAATINVGVEYELPYYRRLHFGLLNSTHIDGPWTWTQFRLSANVRPVDILSASANVAIGTYGFDFGWMLNLCLKKGFNLFAGMDHCLGKLTKDGIPLNSNAKFNFGISFPF